MSQSKRDLIIEIESMCRDNESEFALGLLEDTLRLITKDQVKKVHYLARVYTGGDENE